MAKKQTQNGSINGAIAAAAGLAAVGVATYLMFGPDGKKNRKVVRGWAIKMKGEIIEKLEDAQEVTEPVFNKIVDEVSKKYTALKHVDKQELMAVLDDLRKQWKGAVKHMKPKTSVKKKVAKKVSKK